MKVLNDEIINALESSLALASLGYGERTFANIKNFEERDFYIKRIKAIEQQIKNVLAKLKGCST